MCYPKLITYYFYLIQIKLVICEQWTFGKKLYILYFRKAGYIKTYRNNQIFQIAFMKHVENLYNKSCNVNRTIKMKALGFIHLFYKYIWGKKHISSWEYNSFWKFSPLRNNNSLKTHFQSCISLFLLTYQTS